MTPPAECAVGHGLNREVGPLGELVGDELTHQLRVDGNALGHGTEMWRVAHRSVLLVAAGGLGRRRCIQA